MDEERNKTIHAKGFNMINSSTNEEYRNVFGENPIDYAKIKVGVK